ncbi:hypothetical protein D9611_014952 [Ephemerocybe angulata]|uniref:Uncharacterized protein n=1 Tax=Ephemerocybe angulata TaxID=980116 RepID=A0A8H5BST8_9AGAR|nr:hypothetical protein D9611_014952 [Tulosesus angulatus]
MPSHIPPCRRSRSTNPHPASTPNPTSHGPTPSPSPSPPDFPPLSPPYLPACHVFTKPSPTTASTITAPPGRRIKVTLVGFDLVGKRRQAVPGKLSGEDNALYWVGQEDQEHCRGGRRLDNDENDTEKEETGEWNTSPSIGYELPLPPRPRRDTDLAFRHRRALTVRTAYTQTELETLPTSSKKANYKSKKLPSSSSKDTHDELERERLHLERRSQCSGSMARPAALGRVRSASVSVPGDSMPSMLEEDEEAVDLDVGMYAGSGRRSYAAKRASNRGSGSVVSDERSAAPLVERWGRGSVGGSKERARYPLGKRGVFQPSFNNYGSAVANEVDMMLLSSAGSGFASDVIAGMEFAITTEQTSGDPSVVSMSLGEAVNSAIDTAAKNLVASSAQSHTAVASGNANTPARIRKVITVAATTITGERASLSKFGSLIDLRSWPEHH